MSKNHLKAIAIFLLGTITILLVFIITDAKKISAKASLPSNTIAQVTNVSQWSDVSPNDYYYGALKDLLENYGIFLPQEDGLFRPKRNTTRYEMAIILNNSLKQLEALFQNISNQTNQTKQTLATEADLLSLKKSLLSLQESVGSLRNSKNMSPSLNKTPIP